MKTKEEYDEIFERERAQEYPVLDALELRLGHAVDRARLEGAARVLACPLKASPPNWQHGRVIYAVARELLGRVRRAEPLRLLDIGTAKGFSALCAQWAVNDSGVLASVSSVDVIDPAQAVPRNTVADLSGYLTLREILAPWPESGRISFACATGVSWLTLHRRQIDFAFVDGKHNYQAVSAELALLGACQVPGCAIVCDDVQIPGVRRAVEELGEEYSVEYVEVLPTRVYAIARRT